MQKIKNWIKNNKMLAGVLGLGAGFFFLSHKGGGGDASIPPVAGSGPISQADESYTSPGPYDYTTPTTGGSGVDYGDTPGSTGDEAGPDDDGEQASPTSPGTVTVVVQTPEATTTAGSTSVDNPTSTPAPSGGQTATAQQGITVAGKFFAGATSSTMTGGSKNQYGTYMIHAIRFPGRIEYWWHYTQGPSSGKWTGPHNSPATATPPKPVATSSAPQPTTGGGSSAPAPAAAPTPSTGGGAAPAQPSGQQVGDKFFPGAIGHTMNGGGKNEYGQYVIHIISYPGGRKETWWHYTSGKSAGKWTKH